MTQVRFARDKLHRSLEAMLNEYEAMLVILAMMNADAKSHLKSYRESIESLTKRELHQALADTKVRIQDIRSKSGATLPNGEYALLLAANPAGPGNVLELPAYLAVRLFNRYPRVASALANRELPLHALIELDVHGRYERLNRLQYFILEATLFEDMCAFWNEACTIEGPKVNPHAAKATLKKRSALHRATVSAAFYMVEAYCNGLAFEARLTRGDQLSERELELITEWDQERERSKFTSIRDKLLHYPRILMGAAAPLLQENNCPELNYFLTAAKEFRDAIVHPSPRFDADSLVSKKVRAYMRLGPGECAEIIDAAIAVIYRIGAVTERTKCLFWLQRRTTDGRFADSVFE